MFSNTSKNNVMPNTALKDSATYSGFLGITDFGAIDNFLAFESGHNFLSILKIPGFLTELKNKKPDQYGYIIDIGVRIMETEFKGLSGIEDISAETAEINDGLNTNQFINKIKEQSASTISMRYTEKAGAPLTKLNQLHLTGMYDPRSGFTHYHGMVGGEGKYSERVLSEEVYTMLYWVTDSTGNKIEKAFLILNAQPTKAELSIYEGERGSHDPKEVSMDFTCYVVQGDYVNEMAAAQLKSMTIVKNADNFKYTSVTTKVN